MKDKTVAGLLGILLAGLGIHWFYLGKSGRGIAYLLPSILLCWTIFVPIIIGIINLIEGIMFFAMSKEEFDAKYNTPVAAQPVYTQQVASAANIPAAAPAPSNTAAPTASTKTESLLALKELFDKGILSQEEFEKEKQKILNP